MKFERVERHVFVLSFTSHLLTIRVRFRTNLGHVRPIVVSDSRASLESLINQYIFQILLHLLKQYQAQESRDARGSGVTPVRTDILTFLVKILIGRHADILRNVDMTVVVFFRVMGTMSTMTYR